MSGNSMVGARIKNSDFWSRLAPRERWLLFALTIVALIMVGVLLFVQRGRRLQEVRAELGDLRTAIATLRAEGGKYQSRMAKEDARYAKLATEPISFGSLLDEAERKTGVSVGRQEESPSQNAGDDLTRRDLRFDLRRVSFDKFVEYLGTLEGSKTGVVKTTMLTVRSLNAQVDAVNGMIQMSTWERKAPAPAPGGEPKVADSKGKTP